MTNKNQDERKSEADLSTSVKELKELTKMNKALISQILADRNVDHILVKELQELTKMDKALISQILADRNGNNQEAVLQEKIFVTAHANFNAAHANTSHALSQEEGDGELKFLGGEGF